MSRTRWILSLWLVWHMSAIALGSLPPPGTLPPVDAPRYPNDDRLSSVLTPPVDAAVRLFSPVPAALWHAAGPLRVAADGYLKATALSVQWNMFWGPTQVDEYLRVRYFIGRKGASDTPSWTATELVFPAHREDRVRSFLAYRLKPRDRAIKTVMTDLENRGRAGTVPASHHPPRDLAPIARHFARQFAHDRLLPDERILRTEVWAGVAPNPPRGATTDSAAREARLSVLRSYYDGPIEERWNLTPYAPYRSLERQSDIVWRLEYFEGP